MAKVEERVMDAYMEYAHSHNPENVTKEEGLKSENESYDGIFSIIESLPFTLMSLVSDREGNLVIEAVGGRFKDMYGYEKEELLKKEIDVLDAPEKKGYTSEILMNMPSGYSCFSGIRMNKNGELFDTLINAVRVDGAEPSRFILLESNIRQIEFLADTLEILQTAVNQSANMIVVTDTEGKIEYVNHAFESVTGYSFEEVLGKTPAVLKSGMHDREFYEDLWSTISSGHVWKGEFINRRKDGSTYLEKAVITPVSDDLGRIKAYIAIKEDITEEKRMMEEIERIEKERRKEGVNHMLLSMLLLIFRYAEGNTMVEIVRALGEILEEKVRPFFDEQMDFMCVEKNICHNREAYTIWLSNFFRDIGVENEADVEKKTLSISECPWMDMDSETSPCILCRTLISRSFDWSGEKGRWIQHSCIASGDEKCVFEFRFQEETE